MSTIAMAVNRTVSLYRQIVFTQGGVSALPLPPKLFYALQSMLESHFVLEDEQIVLHHDHYY